MLCPKCDAAIRGDDEFCRNCGLRLHSRIERQKRPATAKGIGCILLCVIIAGFIVWSIVTPTAPVASPEQRIARTEFACAESQGQLVDLNNAAVRGDDDAVQGLVDRNHLALIKQGTNVEKRFTFDGMTSVSVVSGYYTGKTCWLTDKEYEAWPISSK